MKKTDNNKKQKTADKLNFLLENLSHTELTLFLKQELQNNPALKNAFLNQFLDFLPNKDKAFYIEHVNSMTKSVKSKDGFINYYGLSKLYDMIMNLFSKADNLFSQGQYLEYFFLITAVLEGLAKNSQVMDDSSGELGELIDEIFSRILTLCKSIKDDLIRRTILDYCLNLNQLKLFKLIDFDIPLLETASHLISSNEEVTSFTETLKNLSLSDYEKNKVQVICCNLNNRLNEKNDIIGLLEDNPENDLLREELIKQDIDNKNYEKAKLLALKSIELDKDERPGLVDTWIDYLLIIAVKQKDENKIIEYGRTLIISSYYDFEKYYTLLKKHVDPEKWTEFIDDVILEVKEKNEFLIPFLYVKEKYWDRLLELLSGNRYNVLNMLPDYEKYLKKDYSDEVSELYQKAVIELLAQKSGESYYRKACNTIKRIIKLSGKEKAQEFISYLISIHPKKRTLILMLEGIK